MGGIVICADNNSNALPKSVNHMLLNHPKQNPLYLPVYLLPPKLSYKFQGMNQQLYIWIVLRFRHHLRNRRLNRMIYSSNLFSIHRTGTIQKKCNSLIASSPPGLFIYKFILKRQSMLQLLNLPVFH